jgi:Histidine kinase-, DNA gyrase B-, and HSP90-like ATPase
MEAVQQPQEPLVLRFAGQLVEQLGAQLYPRVTAAVAELISNAWDADAENVWVTIPFDVEWKGPAIIEVLDDGNGMTRQDAQDQYLVVGRNRRKDGLTSEGGRPLHGRKGIGKLAAFGTAGLLECLTVRDGQRTEFAIDYEVLRQHEPTAPYEVETPETGDELLNPETGVPLEHGTRVRMTDLKAKRRTGETVFRRSMARRFALDATQMRVFINSDPLERFEYDVDVRFPRDGVPAGVSLDIDEDGWARESIDFSDVEASGTQPATREVRWWIGFTKLPIPDEETRGISILARGKLAQRPFMFENALGTTGQLGQEYLVGEVSADWLDHGSDAKDDLIQSNRDQLQLDNAELEPLLVWGRERLRWALAQRNRVRRERRVGAPTLGRPVEAVLEQAPARSRERLRTLAGRIADFTQADDQDVARAVDAVLQASDGRTARRAGEELRLDGDPDSDPTWALLDQASDAAADGHAGLIETRIDAITQFALAIDEPPVQRLHREILRHPWIVSPLLDGLSSRLVREDDRHAVMTFDAVLPVLDELTIVCWAVGVEPDALDDFGGTRGLAIASSWPETAQGAHTWSEVLALSRAAHVMLLPEPDHR